MLLNYLKITLKVLGRNKFFTFVSLFGVVFTLAILLVMTSFIDHLVAPHYPDVNRKRMLYVGMVDCANPDEGSHRMGPPSYHFIKNYVLPMKSPEMVGIASMPSYANAYVGSKRLKLNLKFSNAEFWKVTEFAFLDGKPFSQQNIDNGDPVAVINEKTRDNYFGEGSQAVGKSIVVENISYRVIGVVKDVPITRPIMSGDVYLPFNTSKSQWQSTSLVGNFFALLLAKSPAELPAMRSEFEHVISKIPMPMTDDGFTFSELNSKAETYLESLVGRAFGIDNFVSVFYLVVGIFMFLFMLLPALNLVNLNVGRIMERSSEIGIRKAFGASASKLVGQFLIENLFITFIGGAVALVIALAAIAIFNESGLIPGSDLAINFRILLMGVGFCFLFGILSGVIPAYRMSRLHVVDSLRGGEQ